MSTDGILIFILAFTGLLTGILALLFIIRLERSGGVVLSYFQLHPDESTFDLRVLYYASIIELLAFLIYALGGALGRTDLLTGARLISVIYAICGGVIAYRWWRRFWPTRRGDL